MLLCSLTRWPQISPSWVAVSPRAVWEKWSFFLLVLPVLLLFSPFFAFHCHTNHKNCRLGVKLRKTGRHQFPLCFSAEHRWEGGNRCSTEIIAVRVENPEVFQWHWETEGVFQLVGSPNGFLYTCWKIIANNLLSSWALLHFSYLFPLN